MVKKLVTNQDMESLIHLKGTVSLCDTCKGCDFMREIEEKKAELYKEAPRHAVHIVVWSCNQYRRLKKGRGRPKKTSNP